MRKPLLIILFALVCMAGHTKPPRSAQAIVAMEKSTPDPVQIWYQWRGVEFQTGEYLITKAYKDSVFHCTGSNFELTIKTLSPKARIPENEQDCCFIDAQNTGYGICEPGKSLSNHDVEVIYVIAESGKEGAGEAVFGRVYRSDTKEYYSVHIKHTSSLDHHALRIMATMKKRTYASDYYKKPSGSK